MYLEETIEALEVQEDSGLSSDEPESILQTKMRPNDISSQKFEGSLNQTTERQPSPDSAANMEDVKLTAPHESSVSGQIQSPGAQKDMLCVCKDGDGNLKIVSSNHQSSNASEIDLGLIPPPLDFMDELELPPKVERAKDPPPFAGISKNKPGEPSVDLEQLYQRASVKTPPVSSPVSHEPPPKPSEVSPLNVSSAQPLNPPSEAAEPRSPPAVAPKPKKLPANIILKSHKTAAVDGSLGHVVPTSTDRLLLDPQRVHMEALRKLGLIKSEDGDSGPALSPKLSPKTRKSWAAPPSPLSPAASHTPPMTPRLHSPSPAPVPSLPDFLPPDIVPAPAAFSDGPLPSDTELNKVSTPPRTPPALFKQLTPPKVKSATLERSGMGLSSFIDTQDSTEADKQSPSQLRNSRPRPASLGSGKEFSNTQGQSSQMDQATSKEPELRRSLPAFQHSGDSQKLPRSQGISVLICPRAENGDNRREALKRLGLLRD